MSIDAANVDTSEQKEAGGKLNIIRKKEEEDKERQIKEKLALDKNNYITDMFGSDFNLTKMDDGLSDLNSLKFNDFKDEAMVALQEKSFHGLYLRLQFWINQIFKRLQNNSEGCNFRLYKNHVMVMKTIICFLSYMRDVVFDLKAKRVDDFEHFEWQKQIRLTWNASESGCKVE